MTERDTAKEPYPGMRVRVPSISQMVLGTITHAWQLRDGCLVYVRFDEPVTVYNKKKTHIDLDWRRCEQVE